MNEWYLAEIPRVFPQISLSREKMSEILQVKQGGFQTFSPKTVRFEGTLGGISKPNVKSELLVSVGYRVYTTTTANLMRFD